MHRKLLLWDIDGTAISAGQAGERALEIAMRRQFGVEANLAEIDYAGRTDAFIARQLFQRYGIEETAEHLQRMLDGYLVALAEEMPRGEPFAHPGVVEILETMAARNDVAMGLLTGNLIRGAETKLGALDLWRFFPFGAFADDHHLRNELGPHAVRRACEIHRYQFPPAYTFVIGDTPHDIACGKVIGAHTIAVATGRFSVEELERHNPSAALPNLAGVASFSALIDRLAGSPPPL
jgi:phosphoglycolate phosphatase